MTPERYQQIADLYQAALEIAPAQRSAYLTEACAGDDDLRQEVEALLSYESQSGEWIDQPALELAARVMPEDQTESPTASMIGRSVGRCRIITLLGKGGMGEVWLAEDIQLRRKVAIKLLPPEFTAEPERVRRFAQEARAASALNHPNIITIYEIGAASTETGNLHYIAAEYVEGQTLRQLIANAPHKQIQIARALAVAIQIAEALAAAHKAGIVHRDIKPENVMVRPDGYVKVLDFGLAKLTEPNAPTVDAETRSHTAHSTEAGIVIGTPRYMSPEQARGEKVDERTDIFSLGIMLYEMLAGQPPFVGATPSEMIAAILRDSPPSLAPLDVPSKLERVIGQALRKDREERYQTAEELLSELNQLKEQLLVEKLVIPPDGGSSHRRTPSAGQTINKRRRVAIFALTGIIVGLAAAAALFYFQRSGPPPVKDTVLLADFDNQTNDDVFDGTLKQGLATQLEQSRFLNVFPEVRVRQTLRQMERTDDTRITPELAQEICERQNLKAFIVGSMSPLGSHFVITLTGMRGSNGEELARVQTTATSKEQVLHALAEAAAQLRARLGESLSSIQQSDQPLEQATTANLQALKAYSTCWKLNTSGRNAEALPFARRAVELDPQFTSAYDQLVINAWATEQMEAAAEHQAKIVRLQEERAVQSKFPASEYFKLDMATWHERLVTGNLNKSLETSLVRVQMYARAFPVQNDLGISYLLNGQPEQSLAPFKETIRLNPNFAAPYKFMARALIRLNRFTEAKDTLTQALQLKLSTSDYHTSLYQLAFINADAAGMQQQLDWAKAKPDEYIALDWQTGATAFTGQWRRTQEYSRRAIEMAAQSDNRELAARYATEQALRSAVLGNCRLAKANTAQGLSFGRGRLPLARAALALALCGAASQAQALTSELAKRFPEDTLSQEVWQPLVRAALQLQRGSNQSASQVIEQLQSTTRYESVAELWPQYLRGLAYLKLGRGTESIAEFQQILDHRGYAPLSPLYSLAHLGLARAATLTGDMEKSRKSYEDFFAAWQQTDLELPILREARQVKGNSFT